ncbi:uncharacterized protein LOC111056497 [Nilaparvata lugens]|uniref:uncharacterized protein LOC111056497 n=1 Tax=Nilaparvata lugens TaxID=108931 RepID=UPI00193E305F|nr:uncharacterized protein LOC111056497 [Nilaparvata lugens]
MSSSVGSMELESRNVFNFNLALNESLVVSAPTGSGKTVLFELAIIRLLTEAENDVHQGSEAKIVYMAPVKALVSEKYKDWVDKFSVIGVSCLEVTGDSDFMSLVTIRDYQLILTTPEKWDSMTRLWKKTDHLAIIQQVRLFLIDEVHLLNEERRGSTLEAVVSRMKTVQKTNDRSSPGGVRGLRFVAVSATIPNGEDLAVWLGTNDRPARFAKIGEDMRPVKLKKFVLGYRNDEYKTSFAFDMSLSYHLKNVVLKYSNGKPTLVFCNSRKSVQTTSSILVKQVKFQTEGADRQILIDAANQISDVTLADLLKAGIGNHHAGMALNDRSLVEQLFRDGKLPVLVATSTLAMGVNLPAHLVVVKSTECYMQNEMKPYTDAQILQMIGRAGRPQFDTSAVAVIMTKMADKERFERLVSGTEPIESTLHKNLAELLNAEVVLRTVTDVAVAVDWISSTYFYVRASRCPQRYGLPVHLPLDAFHARLHDMCMIELNGLSRHKIIEMSGGYDVSPTEEGSLMARFYIQFDTMKQFMQMRSDESIEGLLQLLSKSGEFADVRVRVVEKRLLNSLNGTKKDGERIRFPINEKIKSKEMKVNCLIQATLDGRQVYDNALSQEAKHILGTASRLSRGLVMLVWNRGYFRSLLSALYLSKSLHCSMWENSTFVSRQLPGIGPALSTLLVMAGKTTFRSLLDANPRDLESILNRNPPFGNNLQKDVMSLPMYDLRIVELREESSVEVKLSITNRDTVEEFGDLDHKSALVVGVGGSFNILLHKENIRDQALILRGGEYSVKLSLASAVDFNEVEAHLISTSIVGLDVVTKLRLSNSPPSPTRQRQQNVQTCIDKYMKMKRNIPREKSPKICKVDKNEAKRQSNLSFNMDKFVCRAKSKKSITELSTETESAQEMRTSPFSDNSSHEKSELSVEEGSGAGGNEQKQTRSENSVKLSSGRSHRGLDTPSDIDSGYSSVQVRGNSNRFMTDIHREESKENHIFNSNSSVTSRDDNNTRQSKPEMDVVEQICSKYKGPNSLFKWTKRIPRFSQPKNEPARSDDQLEPTYEEKLVQGICDEVSNRIKAQKSLNPLGRKAANLHPARKAQSTCGTTKITDYLDRSFRNFKSARSLFNDGTPKSTISEPVHGGRGGGILRIHERSEETIRMRKNGRETFRIPSRNDNHKGTSLASDSRSSRLSRNDFEEYNRSVSTRKPQESDIVESDDKSYEASDDSVLNNYYSTPTNSNYKLSNSIDDNCSSDRRSKSEEHEMFSSNYKSNGVSDDFMISNYKRPPYQEHYSSTNRADTHDMQSYRFTSKSETEMLTNDSPARISRPPRSNVPRPLSNEIVLADCPVVISRISRPQVDRRQSQDNGGFRVPEDFPNEINMEEPIALTRMSRARVNDEKSRDFGEFTVSKTQKQKALESDSSIIDTNGTSKVKVIDISCSEESSDEKTASSVASDNKNISGMKMLSSGLPDKIEKGCEDTYPVATPEEKNVENSESVHEKIMTSTTQSAPRFVPEISIDPEDVQATTQIVENFGLRNTKFYPIFSKRLNTMLESSKSLLPETNNYSDEKLDISPENLQDKECGDTIGVENEDRLSQQSVGRVKSLEDSTTDLREMMDNYDVHFSKKKSGLRILQDSDIGSQKILSYNEAQLFQQSGFRPVEDSPVDLHNILGNDSDTNERIHAPRLNSKKNDTPVPNSNQDEIDPSSYQQHVVEAEQTDTFPQNCSQPTSNCIQSQTKAEKQAVQTTYYSKATQSLKVVMGEVANYDDSYYSLSMDAIRGQPSHEQNLPRVDHSSFQQNPYPKTEGRNVNNWQTNKITEIASTPQDIEVATYLHSNTATEGVNYTDLPRYPKEFQVDKNKTFQNNGTASNLSRLSKQSAVYTRVDNNENIEKSNFRNAQVQNNKDYGMKKFNEENNYDRYERFGPKIQYHASDSLSSYTNETQMSRVSPKILPDKSQGPFDYNNQYHTKNHWNVEKDDMKPWQTLSQESCLMLDQTVQMIKMDDFENGYFTTEEKQYEHNPNNVREDARKVVNGADNTTRPAISANHCSNDNYRHKSQPGHEFQPNNLKSDSPISCSESHDNEERIMNTPSNHQLKNVETIEKCQRYLRNQQETKNKYTENKSESLNYKEDIDDEDELLIWDDSRSRYFSCKEGKTSKGDEGYHPSMISSNTSSLKRELIDLSSTANQHGIPLANFNATNMSKLYVETYDPENLVISQEQFSPPIMNSNNNSFEVSDNLLEPGSSFCSQIKLEEPDYKLETSALKMLERCDRKSPIERFGGCRLQVIGGACGYHTSTMRQGLLKTSSHMHYACGSSDPTSRNSNPVCSGRRDLTSACPPKQSCPCFATSHRHNYFAESAPPCSLTSSGCHGACANRCNDVIRTQQPMGCSCYSCGSRTRSQCCATSSQVKRSCCGDGGHSQVGYGHSGVRDFISAGELQARSNSNLTTPSYLLSSSAAPSTCGCSNCDKLSQSLSQNNF